MIKNKSIRWVLLGLFAVVIMPTYASEVWEPAANNCGDSDDWDLCWHQREAAQIAAFGVTDVVKRDRAKGQLCIHADTGSVICLNDEQVPESGVYTLYTYEGNLGDARVAVVSVMSMDYEEYQLVSLKDGSITELVGPVKIAVSPQGGYIAVAAAGEYSPLRWNSYPFIVKIYQVVNGKLVEVWSVSQAQWQTETEGIPGWPEWQSESRLRFSILDADVLEINFDALSEKDKVRLSELQKNPLGWREVSKNARDDGWN